MKKAKIITVLLVLVSVSITAQKLNLDNKKSTIFWTGKAAFSTYKLTGSLIAKEGEILIKNDSIIELKVVIDMQSLNHKNKDLKKHLKNKDFFEVKKYKTATFSLINPIKIENEKAIIIGNMTIKNKTQKEVIEVCIKHSKEIQIDFTTTLNRINYGVKFNSPSFFKSLKQNAIADEFILTTNLIFD